MSQIPDLQECLQSKDSGIVLECIAVLEQLSQSQASPVHVPQGCGSMYILLLHRSSILKPQKVVNYYHATTGGWPAVAPAMFLQSGLCNARAPQQHGHKSSRAHDSGFGCC
jgi:hypothetical protein